MNKLEIAPRELRTHFRPGEEISGEVAWQLEQMPRKIELRLFWFTRGRGMEDVGIVETVAFDAPQLAERRPFHFRLPVAPYSFSGKLISLQWALELVAPPLKDAERLEFLLAPEGGEIHLQTGS